MQLMIFFLDDGWKDIIYNCFLISLYLCSYYEKDILYIIIVRVTSYKLHEDGTNSDIRNKYH